MIIIEGADGAGKTTLIHRLMEETGLPLHERHCTSEGGPKDNLYEWAKQDVTTWHEQPMSIYDRHPLISEYIYGGLLRGGVDEDFLTVEAQELIERMNREALVIFCIPPYEVLAQNTKVNEQMPGVKQNLENLYWAYRDKHASWEGRKIFYDYQISPLADLMFQVKSYLIGRKK